MYGAIIGDISGSKYEFNNIKWKPQNIMDKGTSFTDDTVLTVAVADALMEGNNIAESLKLWTGKYPYSGYGIRFLNWALSSNNKPYNSYGNGAAMRVSPVAWLFDDLDTVRRKATLVTGVTHNHKEGIKGAEATAVAIYLARKSYDKSDIARYIENEFGYDLGRTCDEIRPNYKFSEACQETVPEAITAFLESEDFEDCIKLAISLGGDSDTLAAIAGSIAEAYYGIPDDLIKRCRSKLPKDMLAVIDKFEDQQILDK